MTRRTAQQTKRRLAGTATAALLLTLTACGGPPMEPTVSAEQARQTALKYAHAAAAASFPPGYRLTSNYVPQVSCTDGSDHATGQVNASVEFWVDGPDRSHNDAYYTNLKKWWQNNGWEIHTDAWPDKQYGNSFSKDGYLMNLTATRTGNAPGRLSIGVSSPCVWPHGTPEPKS